MIKQGLVQIYTGSGKGKTTAALGLALRAAGQGNKVLFAQFLKPDYLDVGERNMIEYIPGIVLETVNKNWDMRKSLGDSVTRNSVIEENSRYFEELITAAKKKKYDLIILDEIVFCLRYGLISIEKIGELVITRNQSVEIVMTGRDATKELIAMADLVTEMKQIKHPLERNIFARKGIEY